jgi:hypothetical protein
MLRAISFVLALLIPTAAVPQHVCERTGQVVCGEGQQWDTKTLKCVPIVSS